MISNARGSHSSPGIYTKEIDLSYASKSLGITTLGVVGETLKGPAFVPIKIENWREFQEYFGGTSAEKFAGSRYPKYELPYIAKTYLKNSNNLEVCRVLGLSGYNAGPAWLITASKGESKYVEVEAQTGVEYTPKTSVPTKNEGEYIIVGEKHYKWTPGKYVIGVLRSRGEYSEYGSDIIDKCNGGDASYDVLNYAVKGDIKLSEYTSATIMMSCGNENGTEEDEKEGFAVSETNLGRFTVEVNGVKYPVSLNPTDKDYIINVFGTEAQGGDAPIFVEELYDVALAKMVENGDITKIDEPVTPVTIGIGEDNKPSVPTKEQVIGFKTIPESELTVKNVGQRFVEGVSIYEVKTKVETGKRSYVYEKVETLDDKERIYVASKGAYYEVKDNALTECDMDVNDYKEQFRCASTPWIVSELKGDGENVEVKKLFRFHTISDGNAANHEVKVSIQNIRPDDGLFDVIIRAFDDNDASPAVLERFSKCSMVPGTSNFIGLKIGTFDGEYVTRSKYVTVEVIVNDTTEACVPAGFLGYPMRKYAEAKNPSMGYNVMVDEDIKAKKQYFGFSNLMGIDVDLFKYKGRAAYNNVNSLSDGFHLDSYLNNVTVDGETGFTFATVSKLNYVGIKGGAAPRLSTEFEMNGTIYEDINLRKFTVCFYGGFDGWDVYRESRTNTDKFKGNKY